MVSTFAFCMEDRRFEFWPSQTFFYFFLIKMRQKVSLCLIKFSERDRKVKLALIHFSSI